MKTLSIGMHAHLAGQATSLATCWKVTRRDGTSFHFTDHDQDIAFESATYKASTGFTRTAINTVAGLGIDDLEVEGLLDDDDINARDLRLGRFDGAEVWVFMVNWRDPAMGDIKLRRGYLGEVILQHNGTFRAELRGLLQLTHQKFIEFYSPTCRADLGDGRCGVDMSTMGVTGTISAVTDASRVTVTLSGAELASFSGGYLTFTSGENAGGQYEVAGWDAETGALTLFLAAVYPMAVGDTVLLAPGCDKRFDTCRDVFDNAVNFRGEPFLPGSDMLQAYPGPSTGGSE